MIRIFILLLLFPLASQAAGKGNGGPSQAAMMQSQSHGGGGGGQRYEDPRRAPPMDPKRKINEQDCTKPIDIGAGNLRCKAQTVKSGNNAGPGVLVRQA